MKSISVIEAGRLAAGLCEARGFPADSLPSIALNIIWLEKRGLPGLSNMGKDLFEHWNEDLRQRGPREDAHGVSTFPCPLFAAAFTKRMIDDLVNVGQEKKIDFICEGPIILLLPRLTDHALQNKIALQVEIHPADRYVDAPTSFILHDNEFAVHQGMTRLLGPANILIHIYPNEMLPPKTAFSSQHPKKETVDVQVMLLDLISMHRKGSGFNGALPFENGLEISSAPREPLGLSPLAPTTREFFNRAIDTDHVLNRAFSKLTKGDRSMLHVIVFGDAEGQGHSNTNLVTSPSSANAVFYRQCEKIGWMTPVADDTLSQYNMVTFHVTKTGRMGLSVLLSR